MVAGWWWQGRGLVMTHGRLVLAGFGPGGRRVVVGSRQVIVGWSSGGRLANSAPPISYSAVSYSIPWVCTTIN